MSVIRVSKNNNYTVINNKFLKDERLSWKAKGILAYMLSMPDDWVFYIEELVKHSKDSKASFQSGFKELKDADYVVRRSVRDEKTNKITSWETIVHEVPFTENPVSEKASEWNSSDRESMQMEFHEQDNQPLLSTDLNKVLKEQNTNKQNTNIKDNVQSEIERQFEEFWNLYPKRSNKKQALLKFKLAVEAHGYVSIIDGVNKYIAEIRYKRTGKEFIKNPATFLYNECYNEDFITGNNQVQQTNERLIGEALKQQQELSAKLGF